MSGIVMAVLNERKIIALLTILAEGFVDRLTDKHTQHFFIILLSIMKETKTMTYHFLVF